MHHSDTKVKSSHLIVFYFKRVFFMDQFYLSRYTVIEERMKKENFEG